MNVVEDTSSQKNTMEENQDFLPIPASQLGPQCLVVTILTASKLVWCPSVILHIPIIFHAVANILFLKMKLYEYSSTSVFLNYSLLPMGWALYSLAWHTGPLDELGLMHFASYILFIPHQAHQAELLTLPWKKIKYFKFFVCFPTLLSVFGNHDVCSSTKLCDCATK